MIKDSNLKRATSLLLHACGTQGPERALARAAALSAKGQHRAASTWKDVAALAKVNLAARAALSPPATPPLRDPLS